MPSDEPVFESCSEQNEKSAKSQMRNTFIKLRVNYRKKVSSSIERERETDVAFHTEICGKKK